VMESTTIWVLLNYLDEWVPTPMEDAATLYVNSGKQTKRINGIPARWEKEIMRMRKFKGALAS
jgi:hypothetical protein